MLPMNKSNFGESKLLWVHNDFKFILEPLFLRDSGHTAIRSYSSWVIQQWVQTATGSHSSTNQEEGGRSRLTTPFFLVVSEK